MPPEITSRVAICFAYAIGSCWAGSDTLVPMRSVVVACATAASITIGSKVRQYISGSSSSPFGGGVSRDAGMCVCSGRYRPANPRCSASTASATGDIERSVAW